MAINEEYNSKTEVNYTMMQRLSINLKIKYFQITNVIMTVSVVGLFIMIITQQSKNII